MRPREPYFRQIITGDLAGWQGPTGPVSLSPGEEEVYGEIDSLVAAGTPGSVLPSYCWKEKRAQGGGSLDTGGAGLLASAGSCTVPAGYIATGYAFALSGATTITAGTIVRMFRRGTWDPTTGLEEWYFVDVATGSGGAITVKDDKGGSVTSTVHKVINSTVTNVGGEAVTTIDNASAAAAGLVSLADQTLGNGHKTFQQAVTVNSANTEAPGSNLGVFYVESANPGYRSLRVQPIDDNPSGFFASYVYLMEDSAGTVDSSIKLGQVRAFGESCWRSMVSVSGKNCAYTDLPYSSGDNLVADPGIAMIGNSGYASGKPALQSYSSTANTSSGREMLMFYFDNANARVALFNGGFIGSGTGTIKYAIDRGSGPVDGIDNGSGAFWSGGFFGYTGGLVTQFTASPGDMEYAGSFSQLNRLSIGTPGQVLTATDQGGGITEPRWQTLSLGTAAAENVGFFLQTANDLSDLSNPATARTNLGLAAVAATGDYADLINTPAGYTGNYDWLDGDGVTARGLVISNGVITGVV